MNYDEHAKAVTSKLIEMIATGNTGEWSMPWHTHGFGDHLRARNAATGVQHHTTGACGVFEPGEWGVTRIGAES